MAIPKEFICSGCKKTYQLEEIHLPNFTERMTEEELQLVCEADHPTFGILCDSCAATYELLSKASK